MKKLVFLLLTIVVMSQASFAQFHLGAKAGANITKVDGKSFKDQFNYGYHLGAFMEIKLSKKFFLQPEFLINQYNTKLDSNYNNIYQSAFNGLASVKLDYFSVPVLLNYKLGSGLINLQAGPQFGVLFDNHSSVAQNAGAAFKKGDLSLLGGLQIKIRNIRVNGRYFIGLGDIKDVVDNSKWKNQGFQLSVGLAIL
jgi:hypothetical protein